MVITEGHKLFPPLTFLPFHNSSALIPSFAPIINVNHPFSGWLLNKAPEIASRYPGLFDRIRADLFEIEWPTFWSSNLNATLDRLRSLHPSVRPPKELVIKDEDLLLE